mmetsp:Transcript_36622/g.96475  ORF Transcript_36622/g.96475 Transcript_36622/m.96475 type:complete len:99 (-) Transcript_36622:469-765(-)
MLPFLLCFCLLVRKLELFVFILVCDHCPALLQGCQIYDTRDLHCFVAPVVIFMKNSVNPVPSVPSYCLGTLRFHPHHDCDCFLLHYLWQFYRCFVYIL